MWKTISANPIRLFAVICVAVISGFIMWMRYAGLQVLSSPDWCNRAMKAEKLDIGSRLDAAMACVGLQKIQIEAIASNSLIDGGTLALCLLVLIVIVIAGGRLSVAASKTGVSANIGKDAVDAANHVVEGAKEAAAEVKAPAKFTAPPGETL